MLLFMAINFKKTKNNSIKGFTMLEENIFKNKKVIRNTCTVSSQFGSQKLNRFPELFDIYQSHISALSETNTPNASIRQKQAFKDLSFFANKYKGLENLHVSMKKEKSGVFPIISISNDETYEFLRKLASVYAIFVVYNKENRDNLFPDLKLEAHDSKLVSNREWIENAFVNFNSLSIHYLIDTDLDIYLS